MQPPSSGQQPLNVRLVGGALGAITGLSRYARSLRAALESEGVAVAVAAPELPPFFGPASAAARIAGFDLRAFFTTYPLSLPASKSGVITHLTAQNLASALTLRSAASVVVTVHDLITLAYGDDPVLSGHLTFYDRLFERLTRRGLGRAAWLIADSEHTRRDIIGHLGFPGERISVVYLGIDHETFQPRPVTEGFLARYGLRPDVPYVLYVGSEDPRKNLRRLLDAFAPVLAAVPQAVLLKVGGARFAHERTQLIAAAEGAGVAGSVRFFDQVSDADLASFYNIASVFVFPSLYEGFGLPVLEAMACGTPVVCSSATSLPEVAGDAALMVDPLDVAGIAAAITQVVQDAGLRAALRERGQVQAAPFTWQRTARGAIAVYRQTLAATAAQLPARL